LPNIGENLKNLVFFIIILISLNACTSFNLNADANKQNFNGKSSLLASNGKKVLGRQAYKIAILFPSKVVGNYAYDLINTVSTYMLMQNKQFKIKIYDSFDEKTSSIKKEITKINNDGYKNVVALLTQKGFLEIRDAKNLKNLRIYFPIINRNNYYVKHKNFYFGGVNYKQQLEYLILYSKENIVDFYDDSFVGQRLDDMVKSLAPKIIYSHIIDARNSRYRYLVNHKALNDSSLILNTPIVKTSILLSQIQANTDIQPSMILSTQLNYTPLIFSLTQVDDRKNLVIANSIGKVNPALSEALLLNNVNINYNFLAFSSLVGIDYLFSDNHSGLLNYDMVNNQAIYLVSLYKVNDFSFEEIK